MTSGCGWWAVPVLVCWLSLWTSGSAFSQSGSDSSWSVGAVAADLAKTPKVERLTLDTWIGKQLDRGGMDLGLSIVFPVGRVRPSIQVAPDRLGFGLGWRLVPVIDIAIGVNGVWDLKTGRLEPGVYVSLFRF